MLGFFAGQSKPWAAGRQEQTTLRDSCAVAGERKGRGIELARLETLICANQR
jgi:hypothetical protein